MSPWSGDDGLKLRNHLFITSNTQGQKESLFFHESLHSKQIPFIAHWPQLHHTPMMRVMGKGDHCDWLRSITTWPWISLEERWLPKQNKGSLSKEDWGNDLWVYLQQYLPHHDFRTPNSSFETTNWHIWELSQTETTMLQKSLHCEYAILSGGACSSLEVRGLIPELR